MEKTFLKKDSPILDQTFHSSGKLLLTGEYLVLKGAKAFALKTKAKQSLSISSSPDEFFHWKAIDKGGDIWLSAQLKIERSEFKIVHTSNTKKSERLLQLLNFILEKKPELFHQKLTFETEIEFDMNWGLGTSSTLVANLSKWSDVDAFELLENSFGGSGYDVAVAMKDHSILYENNVERSMQKVVFDPPFKDNIFFVYLNEKQNSREAVSSFSQLLVEHELPLYTEKVNELTKGAIHSKTLEKFEHILIEHEAILSKLLKQETVKDHLFPDYAGGVCKSLGAWGGDFILVTGKPENMAYFRDKGYNTVLSFKDMINEN